jgi:anti-anti-sigma factor
MRTSGFTATVTVPDPNTLTVHLAGELTFETDDDLDGLIAGHLRELPDVREIVLDCTAITEIDSMGLSILLMIKRRAQQADIRLRLDNRPARLERMLSLTGTYAYLTTARTEETQPAHPWG